MDSFKVELVKSIDRDSRKIEKKQLKRILEAIHTLSEEPFPSNCKKLKDAYKQ